MSGTFSKRITLSSPDATTAFAVSISATLVRGDVLLLSGDVGAGKTHFARAIIQARLAAAGLAEDVPSPTYTLVQTYDDGICDIWHADLYRLSGAFEVPELGLTDAFQDAVCIIEWPDRLGEFQPKCPLSFEFNVPEKPGHRDVVVSGDLVAWGKIMPMLLSQISTEPSDG